MVQKRLDIASRVAIQGAPRIRLSNPNAIAGAASAAAAQANIGRDLQRFGEGAADTFFNIAAAQREREGLDAAASVTFEKAAVEHHLNVDGETRVVRDESGLVIPQLPDKNSISIFDQTYNRAIFARYGAEVEAGARETISGFHNENRMDPKKISTLGDAYVNSLVENAPPGARAHVRDVGNRLVKGYVGQASEARAAFDYKSAVDAVTLVGKQAGEDVINTIVAGATTFTANQNSSGGVTITQNPEITGAISSWANHLKSLLDMKVINASEAELRIVNMNQQLGVAQKIRDIQALGSTEAGFVKSTKLVQGILTGRAKVNKFTIDPDGQIKFVEVSMASLMTPDKRAKLAGELNSYAQGMQKTRIAHEAMIDRIQSESFMSAMRQEVLNVEAGAEPDVEGLLNRIKGISDPRFAMSAVNSAINLQGVYERQLREQGQHTVNLATIQSGKETVLGNPQAVATMNMNDQVVAALVGGNIPEDVMPAANLAELARKTVSNINRINSAVQQAGKTGREFDEMVASNVQTGGTPGATSKQMEAIAGDRFAMNLTGGEPVTSEAIEANVGAVIATLQRPEHTHGALPPQIATYLQGALKRAQAGDENAAKAALTIWKSMSVTGSPQRNLAISGFLNESVFKAYEYLSKEMEIFNSVPDQQAFDKAVAIASEEVRPPSSELTQDQNKLILGSVDGVLDTRNILSWVPGMPDAASVPRSLEGAIQRYVRNNTNNWSTDEEIEKAAEQGVAKITKAGRWDYTNIMANGEDVLSPGRKRWAPNSVTAVYGLPEQFFADILNAELKVLQEEYRTTGNKNSSRQLTVGENVFLSQGGETDDGHPIYKVVHIDAGGNFHILDMPRTGLESNWGIEFKDEVREEMNRRAGRADPVLHSAVDEMSAKMLNSQLLLGKMSPEARARIAPIIEQSPAFKASGAISAEEFLNSLDTETE